jgi:hypothetical protein
MKGHIVTAIIGILTLIIGALLGYYVDIFKDEQKNQMKFLDVRVATNKAVLRKLTTKDNENVTLTWKNNEIEAVSKITVEIYNFSKQDFEKVPLFINFQNNDTNQIEVIDIQGESDSGIEGHIKKVGFPKLTISNSKKYGYEIDILNRANGYKPSYSISFLIKGSKLPKVEVSINKKGVKSREFTIYRLNDESIWDTVTPILVGLAIIGFYIVLLFYVIRFGKKRAIKRYRELVPFVSDKLKSSGMPEDKLEEKSIQLVQDIRLFHWNKLGKMDKKITDKPQMEELESELTRK